MPAQHIGTNLSDYYVYLISLEEDAPPLYSAMQTKFTDIKWDTSSDGADTNKYLSLIKEVAYSEANKEQAFLSQFGITDVASENLGKFYNNILLAFNKIYSQTNINSTYSKEWRDSFSKNYLSLVNQKMQGLENFDLDTAIKTYKEIFISSLSEDIQQRFGNELDNVLENSANEFIKSMGFSNFSSKNFMEEIRQKLLSTASKSKRGSAWKQERMSALSSFSVDELLDEAVKVYSPKGIPLESSHAINEYLMGKIQNNLANKINGMTFGTGGIGTRRSRAFSAEKNFGEKGNIKKWDYAVQSKDDTISVFSFNTNVDTIIEGLEREVQQQGFGNTQRMQDTLNTELREIKDTFVVHTSIKDYLPSVTSSVGITLEGTGSLNTRLDLVRKIILETKTIDDMDYFISAIHNVAEGALAEGKKDILEYYLGSMAAAYMFDDFLEMYSDSIETKEASVKNIHLYNIGGTIYPLSNILYATYEQLLFTNEQRESNSDLYAVAKIYPADAMEEYVTNIKTQEGSNFDIAKWNYLRSFVEKNTKLGIQLKQRIDSQMAELKSFL